MTSLRNTATGDAIRFELVAGEFASGTITRTAFKDGQIIEVEGELTAPEAGRFSFRKQTMPGKAGDFTGEVIFPSSKKAYRIEPIGPGGTSELVERRLDEVICLTMPKMDAATEAALEAENIPPLNPQDVPDYVPAYNDGIISLQSRPDSIGVIYIDYRGGYTPTWGGITYTKPNVSNATIKDVWKRVAEDYMAFNINVTTDIKVYEAAPENSRQRCVVTTTSTAAPGAGGVAFVGDWDSTGDRPCWSFYTGGKAAAEVISHEIGHTLELGHDGRTSPSEGYYGGHGSGAVGWAPIMGVGYYAEVTQWSKGEYANANNTQNDLTVIVNNNNNVDYRADDTGATLATARYLELYSDYTAFSEGVIETTADTDAFRFTTTGGAMSLSASAVGDWADLAIMATLANASDTIIASNNPQTQLGASIATNLPAGTYTFHVTGAGRNNPLTDGFSSYASLGYYSVTGSVAGAVLPARFTVSEDSTNGFVVGTVTATNLGTDPLVYVITAGNTSSAFAINSNGVLSVANSAALNYETLATQTQLTVQYQMFVNITNLANPSFTELNRRVVVQVLDVNEPPTISGFSATVISHTQPGTVVGTVTASDPDFYTVLSLSIVGGNSNSMFALDNALGAISVVGDLNSAAQSSYTLSVRAMDNGAPNLSGTNTVLITVNNNSTPFQPGSLSYALYDGIGSGTAVSDLTSNTRFPTDPTSEKQMGNFEGDTDRADSYGSVMRGFLIPPQSGSYTFFIASDDNSELWISTTTNPASMTLAASISGSGNWASPRQWNKFASQTSTARSLTAGQGYYIEARQKDGSGGDNLAVGWKGPATANLTNVIPGLYLAPRFINYLPHLAGFTNNSVRRDTLAGAKLGRQTVTDANSTDTHTFTILSGNTGGIFSVDASGWVRVADQTALQSSVTTNFSLSIRATDSGTPPLSATGAVALTIVDSNAILATTLQRELFYYLGSGTAISDLTSSSKYPGKPDALTPVLSGNFDTADDVADGYGSRIRGYVVPSVSGDYQFFIASDDDGQLNFSLNTNPASATVIASVTGWTAANEWNKFPLQASALQPLVAGQRYYIEALQKDGGGGDNVSVGWLVPGSGVTNIIPAGNLQPIGINVAPQIVAQTIGVSKAVANGTVAGSFNALDSPLDVLTFKLTGGNTNNTFTLTPDGSLSVADNTLIANGTAGSFNLSFVVQDSGYGGLYPLRTATGTVAVVVVPPGSYVEAVVTNTPVGYWRLGETSGTAAADLVGGHNGTYANATLGQIGALGSDTNRCPRFNGASTYVGTGQSLLNNLATFTLEGWFKLAATPAKMGFFGQNDTVEFGLFNSTTIQIWTPGGGSVNVNYTWGQNSWHHLVAVGTGADLRVYVDGNLVGTGGTATTNYGASGYAFNIGGGGIWDASGNWFNGWLDEVALYDKVLSAAEVRRHYLLGLALPIITLTSPANNAAYTATANIPLSASVTANGHTITNVQFFNNTTLLSDDATAPYGYTWTGVGAGATSLTAVVNYDTGSVTSSVANVTITNPAPTVISGSAAQNGSFSFTFTGTVGQHYQVEFASALPAGPWQTLTDIVSLAQSPFTISDPATNGLRFYRVIWVP